jgi:hypothetical protein
LSEWRGTGTPRLLRVMGPVPEPVPLANEENGSWSHFDVRLRASPTHLGTSVSRSAGWRDVFSNHQGKRDAGPLAGPAEELGGCGPYSDAPFDVDGARVAYSRSRDCQSAGGHEIVVRDLDKQTDVAVIADEAPGSIADLRLAGRYLAWSRESTPDAKLTVYDLDARAVVTTIPGEDPGFDLRPDGTVVRVPRPGESGCAPVETWSLGARTPTTIDRCASAPVAVDGADVAFVSRAIDRNGVAGKRHALVVAGVDGTHRRERLVWSVGSGGLRGLDLDGGRLAYAVEGCTYRAGGRLYVDDGSGAAPTERLDCKPRLARTPLKVDTRTRRLTVPVRCPNGCGGLVQLVRPKGYNWVPASSFAEYRFDTRGTFGVTLTADAAQVVRRSHGPLRWRFEHFDSQQPAFPVSVVRRR